MKIRELTSYLESIAPLAYQESYDNAGLIVGNADDEADGLGTIHLCHSMSANTRLVNSSVGGIRT